jgi:hypothetical protein
MEAREIMGEFRFGVLKIARMITDKSLKVIDTITSLILLYLPKILSRMRHSLSYLRNTPMMARKFYSRLYSGEKEKSKLSFGAYKRSYQTQIESIDRGASSFYKIFTNKKYIILTMFFVMSLFFSRDFIISNLFFKPKVKITTIDYNIEYYEFGCHQVFTGYIKNFGKADAYDVEVYVTWAEIGGRAYTDSVYLGTISPEDVQSFSIEFNVPDVLQITHCTQSVTYSSRKS